MTLYLKYNHTKTYRAILKEQFDKLSLDFELYGFGEVILKNSLSFVQQEALATYVSAPFNIKFSLIEPGGISTAFMKDTVEKMSSEQRKIIIDEYASIFQKYMEGAQD
ncbi:hypothetical protein MWU59_10405 [Flavobacteriaceae bacterium F08102]|nr:hypothetical protein [Flavobacteriaceae bacterium F08102]